MNKKRLTSLAKKIIKTNQYLSLGTVNSNRRPWVSPIYYCCDKSYTFYYASLPKSVHSKNIFHNQRVAFAIFSTKAAEGEGAGVQIDGKASIIKLNEMKKALKVYSSTFVTAEMLGKKGPYRLFKLIPQHIYVTDPDAKIDRRVEIKL